MDKEMKKFLNKRTELTKTTFKFIFSLSWDLKPMNE